ncbi:MAG: hypothetical protein HZA24_02770 [Nitrospirae bacterium]|nr:hypothetical protein [Nitrospirota bacterium]
MSVAFVESVKRCTQSASFLDRLHEEVMLRGANVRVRFAGVDVFKAKYLFNRLLMALVRRASGVPGTETVIGGLAGEFGPRGLNLPEAFFLDWQEALLAAVRATDRQLTPELEREWRQVTGAELGHFVATIRVNGGMAAGW